ncbi:MAG: fimbrillin family protein [Bacteroidales bacterium]
MKIFLSCIICYIAITSCSGDIAVLNESYQSESPLSLASASVSDLTVTRNSLKQSEGPLVTTTLPEGSKIGLTLYTPTDSDPYANYVSVSGRSENLCFINENAGASQQWQLKTPEGAAASFYLHAPLGYSVAYYPYRPVAVYAPDAQGIVGPAMQLQPGTTDYLYGSGRHPVNNRMPVSEIGMRHAMSMISFVFTHDDKYLGNCNLQQIKLKNIYGSALLALADGNISNISVRTDTEVADYDAATHGYAAITPLTPVNFKNKPDFGISSPPTEGAILSEPARFHIFVIPQTGASNLNTNGIYLELLIDDILYRIPFPNDRLLADGSKGFCWRKEVNTLYRITISKNNVRLSYLLDDFEQGGDSDFEFGRALR